MSTRLLTPAICVLAGMMVILAGEAGLRAGDDCPRCKNDLEREMDTKLLTPINYLNLHDTPLRQVLQDLRSWQNINLVPDEEALREEGINLDRPVTMKLEGVSLKTALDLLLKQAGLAYVVRDGVLHVTTPRQAQGRPVQKVYPVADLIIPIDGTLTLDCNPAQKAEEKLLPPPFADGRTEAEPPPAPAGPFPEPRPIVWTATRSPSPNLKQTREDQLIQLIKSTIAPRSWSEMGGSGTIDYFPQTMALVINQTLDIHEQIAGLMDSLRRMQEVEICVELRFIHLPDEVWERVRADFCVKQPAAPAGCGKCTAEARPSCKDCRPSKVAFLDDRQMFLLMEIVQGDQRSNVMQAPKITMFNGQSSTINVTDQQFFVTGVNVRWDGDRVVAIPQNEVVTTGLRVTLQPVVSADRRFVRLDLKGGLTSLESQTVPLSPVTTRIQGFGEDGEPREQVPFTQFIQTPRLAKIVLDNTLSIPDGRSALLYAGKQACECRNEFGPPVLSKIPYVNRLFKNVGYGRDTKDVLVLITPRVIINEQEEIRPAVYSSPAEAQRAAEKESAGAAVEPASTLPPPSPSLRKEKDVRLQKKAAPDLDSAAERWKEKKVAKLMEKYEQACEEGRLDEARNLAGKALVLDPTCFRRDR